MTAAISAVFAFTYVLIASRRLQVLPIGRPAAALAGAVLMVVIGALSPAESYHAIDFDTLALLLGMMLLTAYWERAGLFSWVTARALQRLRWGWSMLVAVSALSAVLSALFVNDTVCLMLTPLVVRICAATGLPFAPFLIALATSANIGSAATLVGNPQNMMIGTMSGMGFGTFLLRIGPATAVGWLLNLALLALYYRRQLARPVTLAPEPTETAPGRTLVLVVTAIMLLGFFSGLHLASTTLAAVVLLIVVQRKDPQESLARVDWPLLLFFACLFIVVQAFLRTGLVAQAWQSVLPYVSLHSWRGLAVFGTVVAIGSNLVSNVPMTLLTGPYMQTFGRPELGWVLLAFVSTVAGNLTLVGSVANIIVAERARDHYELRYGEYLAFGLVSTIVVLVAGVPLVWAVDWLLRIVLG